MSRIQEYEICQTEETTSTNQVCMDLGKQGKAGHYVFVAEKQTAGRGRLGKEWESQEGAGIYMSILERPELEAEKAPMLSILMGLAARQTIEQEFGMQCGLKWPNDLVYNGKKVAGILAQMKMMTESGVEKPMVDYVVVGIGVNLFQKEFCGELKTKATSIFLEGFCDVKERDFKTKLIQSLVISWKEYYDRFLKVGNLAPFLSEYHSHLVNKDKIVRVHDTEEEFTGVAQGINQNGELLVSVNDEIIEVKCGEVSVRGVYGYAE